MIEQTNTTPEHEVRIPFSKKALFPFLILAIPFVFGPPIGLYSIIDTTDLFSVGMLFILIFCGFLFSSALSSSIMF